MVHHVKDLSAGQRSAIEALLGRELHDEEALSIRPIPVVKDAPPLARRMEIARGLHRYFNRLDSHAGSEPPGDAEIEAACDEAMLHVRPSYRPVE